VTAEALASGAVGLRDDRDCLRLTATRESTSPTNAVTGHVKFKSTCAVTRLHRSLP
jgi:hypothetical protein